MLISKGTAFRVEKEIKNITISAHAPITLTIGLDNKSLFRYWRLNVSILSCENVVKKN